MNAKNVTPEEVEPTEPIAEDTATAEPAAQAAVKPPPTTSTAPSAASSGADSVETAASTAGATGEVTPVAESVQTVYITAPQPPKKKGNRGLGSLLTILATVVFAAVYAGLAGLLILFVQPDGVSDALGQFVTGPLFYIPVLVFLVIMVLWVLLANRASWWAWVIGSLVIAVIVYLASIGVLLLLAGGFGLTASQATETFYGFAGNPVLVAAALLAREVAIWFGAAIAVRGRKVRERNYEAWETFEREEAEKRAEFGGRTAF